MLFLENLDAINAWQFIFISIVFKVSFLLIGPEAYLRRFRDASYCFKFFVVALHPKKSEIIEFPLTKNANNYISR